MGASERRMHTQCRMQHHMQHSAELWVNNNHVQILCWRMQMCREGETKRL